jgi:hypothetical protein
VGRCGDRNTSHQAGNPKPCYETLDLTLVHDLTTFLTRDDRTNTLRCSLAIDIHISIVIYDNTAFSPRLTCQDRHDSHLKGNLTVAGQGELTIENLVIKTRNLAEQDNDRVNSFTSRFPEKTLLTRSV